MRKPPIADLWHFRLPDEHRASRRNRQYCRSVPRMGERPGAGGSFVVMRCWPDLGRDDRKVAKAVVSSAMSDWDK
jgi:hypothetical protein